MNNLALKNLQSDILDRAIGCLVGLAIGDALGTTLEFSERDRRPLHTEILGGGPFRLQKGEWTDDTSMALALADSLLINGGFRPQDLMERFVSWVRNGEYSCTGKCFDVGITTVNALRHFQKTGEPFAGSLNEDQAGNGSIMRLAPGTLFALNQPSLALYISKMQSRTTHGAPQAVDGCAYFSFLLRKAIMGHAPKRLFSPRVWRGHPTIQHIADGEWRYKTRSNIRSGGYVVDTLEAALWSIYHTESFEEALILAVNLGGDADTVGAVTGQLAGAIYGFSGIPQRWLDDLKWLELIKTKAQQLVEINGGIVSAIADLLLAKDPMRINYGEIDEYLSEAISIFEKLPLCKDFNDVNILVYEVFKQSFAEDLSGLPSEYQDISENIFYIWTSFKF